MCVCVVIIFMIVDNVMYTGGGLNDVVMGISVSSGIHLDTNIRLLNKSINTPLGKYAMDLFDSARTHTHTHTRTSTRLLTRALCQSAGKRSCSHLGDWPAYTRTASMNHILIMYVS